jgi:hypothetical protein
MTEVSNHYNALLVIVPSDGDLIEQIIQLFFDSFIQGYHPMLIVLEDTHLIKAEVNREDLAQSIHV